MPTKPDPSDALFIRWGKFQAGAFGRPAIFVLGLIAVAAVVALWLRVSFPVS